MRSAPGCPASGEARSEERSEERSVRSGRGRRLVLVACAVASLSCSTGSTDEDDKPVVSRRRRSLVLVGGAVAPSGSTDSSTGEASSMLSASEDNCGVYSAATSPSSSPSRSVYRIAGHGGGKQREAQKWGRQNEARSCSGGVTVEPCKGMTHASIGITILGRFILQVGLRN